MAVGSTPASRQGCGQGQVASSPYLIFQVVNIGRNIHIESISQSTLDGMINDDAPYSSG